MKLSTEYPLAGVILTGPARLHHLGPLCEMLPTALPALALSLRALVEGHSGEDLMGDVLTNTLRMPPNAPLDLPISTRAQDLPDPSVQYGFPGSAIYRFVEQLEVVKRQRRVGRRKDGSLDLVVADAITELRLEAESLLSRYFCEEDVAEFVSHKLGLEETSTWRP